MKLKKSLLLALTFVSVYNFAYAGDPSEAEKLAIQQQFKSSLLKKSSLLGPKAVVKFNLSGLVLRNLPFQFEYAFHKNMSGAIGVNKLLTIKAPKMLTTGDFLDARITGISVTPEFRFYPGKKEKHQAPHGFYFAAYSRYMKFAAKAEINQQYLDAAGNGIPVVGDVEVFYKGLSYGLMIGSQWLIGDHFSIDFYIVGAHFGRGKVGLEINSPNISQLSTQEIDEFKDDIESGLGEVVKGAEANVSGNTATVSAPAAIFGLRGLGLSIGFAF